MKPVELFISLSNGLLLKSSGKKQKGISYKKRRSDISLFSSAISSILMLNIRGSSISSKP
jgi:hypothetical protein